MQAASSEAVLREKFAALEPVLDERTRRLWAALEAKAWGRGGQSLMAKITGLSRSTLYLGLQELKQAGAAQQPTARADRNRRIRRPGGGRKSLLYHQPTLLGDLEALVESTTRGDPESPLR